MSSQVTNNGKKSKLGKYLKSTKNELKKVSWPNKKELKKNTIIVLIVCILATIFLGTLDVIFSNFVSFLLNL